jgi:hypothetical protein
MIPRVRLPVLSSAWMRASIAPALIFIATATDHNYLADFWHHLARGRAIASTGRLLDADQFTFTVAGQPFQDVNWFTQVLYFHLHSWGGLPLVQFVNSLTLALTMALLVHLCWRASGSLGLASAMGVFTFFGLWQVLTIRPQTFSFLLFVLLYQVLDRAGKRPAWLVVAPPVMALWANLHGAFPAGLILIGAFLAAATWENGRARHWRFLLDQRTLGLALCLAASILATLANPYGWHIYQYVGATSASAADRRIDEWLPPNLNMLIGKFWVISLLLALAAFALPRRRPTVREVFLVICFVPLACSSARMVPWWLLILAPILARLFAAYVPQAQVAEKPAFAPAAFFGLIVAAVILSVPGLDRYNPLLGPGRRAAQQTQENLEAVVDCLNARGVNGRIFARFEWSEFLTWSLGPRYTVFMDGRIEIFPDDVWAQYAAITQGKADWNDILDRYHVDYLLVDSTYHAGTGLLEQVERAPAWQPVYQAGNAVLFVRRRSA